MPLPDRLLVRFTPTRVGKPPDFRSFHRASPSAVTPMPVPIRGGRSRWSSPRHRPVDVHEAPGCRARSTSPHRIAGRGSVLFPRPSSHIIRAWSPVRSRVTEDTMWRIGLRTCIQGMRCQCDRSCQRSCHRIIGVTHPGSTTRMPLSQADRLPEVGQATDPGCVGR